MQYSQFVKSNELELEIIEENVNDTKCNKCGLHFRAVLATNGSRHHGLIKTLGTSPQTLWENSLPKDRVRSVKLLNENLLAKLEKHQERHKND